MKNKNLHKSPQSDRMKLFNQSVYIKFLLSVRMEVFNQTDQNKFTKPVRMKILKQPDLNHSFIKLDPSYQNLKMFQNLIIVKLGIFYSIKA